MGVEFIDLRFCWDRYRNQSNKVINTLTYHLSDNVGKESNVYYNSCVATVILANVAIPGMLFDQ